MLKNIARLEHKVGERVYHFMCDCDAPLGECHDALMKFKDHVMQAINVLHDKQKEQKEEKPETE